MNTKNNLDKIEYSLNNFKDRKELAAACVYLLRANISKSLEVKKTIEIGSYKNNKSVFIAESIFLFNKPVCVFFNTEKGQFLNLFFSWHEFYDFIINLKGV